jgi:hypothetical protein
MPTKDWGNTRNCASGWGSPFVPLWNCLSIQGLLRHDFIAAVHQRSVVMAFGGEG